jgi:hypothetical protein
VVSQISIKAGQILHAMNQFIVDRIQTGGAQLNIPQDRVYELGNFQSVGIIRDVPDLTFSLDNLDVDTEVEALLCGSVNPSTDVFGSNGSTGTKYQLANCKPVDVASPFKSAQGAFDVVQGIAVPHLTLESASYRYGLRDNAGEQFSLRGDSIFYVPAPVWVQTVTIGAGTETDPILFNSDDAVPTAMTALKYTEQGQSIYALNVSVNGVRKIRGVDYTDSTTQITWVTGKAPVANDVVRIVFGSSTKSQTYAQSVHEGVSVKPAAIRGKDIRVLIGGVLWGDVQSVNIDWRVTLEDDYEFGNPRAVSRDYSDVPEVSGSIDIKPSSTAALMDKLTQITGVTSGDIIGAMSSVALPLEVQLLNPDSGGTSAHTAGTILKTLVVGDARFTVPGYEGRAQQKLTQTLNFTSDGGLLDIFKGRKF